MDCLFLNTKPCFPGGISGKKKKKKERKKERKKKPLANAGDLKDMGLIPEAGRFSGEGKWQLNPVFSLENSMDIGVWWAKIHRVTKSWTQLK